MRRTGMYRVCLCLALLCAGSFTTLSAQGVLISQDLGLGAYTASSTYTTFTPEKAFDGDGSTYWSSSGYVEWVEVDLGREHDLSQISLTVEMSPDGAATHRVWLSDQPIQNDRSAAWLAHEFLGPHQNGEILEFLFSAGASARYVQIQTFDSISWVGWREIEIFDTTRNVPKLDRRIPYEKPRDFGTIQQKNYAGGR